jgi:RNA polymerase sigma factor (sigma-70 family)
MATSDATHRAIDAVWRIEAAKVIAGVARMVRDVGLAEELAQDALVAALEHWPDDGVPDNPGAWLMRTAKNRALDRLRQEALHARKHEELGADMEALQAHVEPDFVDALAESSADDIGDDLLRLVFTACHPLLPTEGRVALTVRLLGGLTTDEIARAFLVPEATIAAHVAKRTLAAARCRSGAGAASERRGWHQCSGRLPDLQRGLLGRRRRLDASRPLRRGAAPWRVLAGMVPAERVLACRAHGAEPRGPMPASMPPAGRCCCWSRTARAGIPC